MTNVNDPNSRREFPQEAEGSSFTRADLAQPRLHCGAVRRRCVLGVPERRHAGGGQQSSWRRAQDADGDHRPKRTVKPRHTIKRAGGQGQYEISTAHLIDEKVPRRCGASFTHPSRCASASSHTAPTSSSDSPTAAEPHVLDGPDLGVDFTRHPVGKLFDRGVEQLDHHQQDDDADQRQARPGGRHRSRRRAGSRPGEPTISCRNAASVRIAAFRPFQELMVARSRRSMAAEFSPTRGTQASGYPRKSTCA